MDLAVGNLSLVLFSIIQFYTLLINQTSFCLFLNTEFCFRYPSLSATFQQFNNKSGKTELRLQEELGGDSVKNYCLCPLASFHWKRGFHTFWQLLWFPQVSVVTWLIVEINYSMKSTETLVFGVTVKPIASLTRVSKWTEFQCMLVSTGFGRLLHQPSIRLRCVPGGG